MIIYVVSGLVVRKILLMTRSTLVSRLIAAGRHRTTDLIAALMGYSNNVEKSSSRMKDNILFRDVVTG